MPERVEDLSISDIPDETIESIGAALNKFLLPIVKDFLWNGVRQKILAGSCTITTIDENMYLLTAGHVWNELKDLDSIDFVLTEGTPSAFSIATKHIDSKIIWDACNPDTGPDLAILKIDAGSSSDIMAFKSSINLRQHRGSLFNVPAKIEKGLWAITGVVNEFTEVNIDEEHRISTIKLHGRALVGPSIAYDSNNGYDYIDISSNRNLPGVPANFGGVSGGGLWQINLRKTKDSRVVWDGRRYFRGVAFWQSSVVEGRRIVRCHGPKSLFSSAWSRWDFPV